MSLHAFSGASSHLAHRAPAHANAVRDLPKVRMDIRARIDSEHNTSKRESFVDIVARQLPHAAMAGSVAAPIARRGKAVPFGKRVVDDNYTGPIDLDQDEFDIKPTRVRRQSPSNLPPSGGSETSTEALFQNGDVGRVQALYANGTTVPIMVADVVYATQGSDDGSAKGMVPLQAKIVTADGGAIASGLLFSLRDYLNAYHQNDTVVPTETQKPYIGIHAGQNAGAPYWLSPIAASNTDTPEDKQIWAIDTTTGVLSATYSGSAILFATNLNKVADNTDITGNGDTDAFSAGTAIPSNHSPMQLQLVKLTCTAAGVCA